MDEIQKVLVKVGRKDLAQQYYEKIAGKKRYYEQHGIGTVKYVVNFHDGKSKHKDGSDFFDIKTFKNKKKMEIFINDLKRQGYKEGR